MTVLPIVDRELRTAARRHGTYWVRVGLAFLAILIGSAIFVFTIELPPYMIGRVLFGALAGLLFLYCLGYGRRSTADCLSQEKRDGTLGLLFLTDLKGHDVVFGKLAATSLKGFFALIAVFPVLAVPLLLGGVSNAEFWRMVLVLLNTFWLSLAIGIFGSAISREHRRALAANFLLLLLIVAAPPALAGLLAASSSSPVFYRELLLSCPGYSFYLCADTNYALARDHFWSSAAVTQGIAWLLIILASATVPRSWQDKPAKTAKPGWRDLWRKWSFGDPLKQKEFRRRALPEGAFYWLAAWARLKPLHVWTFLGFMVLWWLFGWLTAGKDWHDSSVAVVAALLLNGTLKCWLALEAGQQLAEDRKSGAFELLLSTPLTDRDIMRGQWQALRRQFLMPLIVVIGVELFLTQTVYERKTDSSSLAIWFAGIFMLVLDLITLGWVGLWRALVSKNHNQATFSTIVRVLVLPWALFGVLVAVGNLWHSVLFGREWEPGWKLLLDLWLVLGLSTDAVFGGFAWWRLRTGFRTLALREVNKGPSRVQAWLGRRKSEPVPSLPATAQEKKSASVLAPRSSPSEKEAPAAPLPSRRREKQPPSILRFLRKRVVAACLLLLIAAVGWTLMRHPSNLRKPLIVSLANSNGPLKVFPSWQSAVMVLHDGSAWRWGQRYLANSWATVPEPVGTNHDWADVESVFTHSVGLRRDGTIWEWGLLQSSALGRATTEQQLVSPDHDWVVATTSPSFSAGLRKDGTLWMWGDTSLFQPNSMFGGGPAPVLTDPTQVGTNNDWVAVKCLVTYILGLRRDGTLWAWGSVPIASSGSLQRLPHPTQACRETNWAGFGEAGHYALVQTRTGEIWRGFSGTLGPDAPLQSVCSFVVSNSSPSRLAVAWSGKMKLYQVCPDGTLQSQDYSFAPNATPKTTFWQREGKSSDWVSLWGWSGTAFGLTSDGTLWTWGADLSTPPKATVLSQLGVIRSRLSYWATGTPPLRVSSGSYSAQVLKKPTPLMQLVFTNTAPR
jgi:ABC-type transport system involved in multi-copper enzyme maturation permease subunit